MKCVVVCSGKGGTGKSCVAAYTGAALAMAGRKTLLMELGADARALDLILGVSASVYGTSDAAAERCEPEDAIVPAEGIPGLFVMSAACAAVPNDPGQVSRLLRKLRGLYDFVLADGADLNAFPITAANTFLLTLTPDSLCVRACADTSRKLFASGAGEVRLVINNVPARIVPISGVKDFDDIIDVVGAQLIGVIPASPKLSYCANNSQRLSSDSLTVKVFENLAGRLMGQRRSLLVR